MATPCYNTQCLNRYLREQDENDALERAAEDLSVKWYEEVEAASRQHPLLQMFIEQQEDAMNDFLMDEAKKQICSDQF